MNKTPILLFLLFALQTISYGQEMRFLKVDMNSGLSFNSVMCVMEDHKGYLWIGTREGLNMHNSQDNTVFKYSIKDSTSLSNNHINCIIETSDHEIWVGTANGLNHYDRLQEHFIRYIARSDSYGLTNGYVSAIYENTDGKIWVGTSVGLNIFSPADNCFEHIYMDEASQSANHITAIFADHDKNIWLSTKGGLYLFHENQFKLVSLAGLNQDHPSHMEIRDIKQGSNGTMWLATETHGILSFNYSEGQVLNMNHRYSGNSDLVSDQVRKILVEDDKVWLATLEGLGILDIKTGRIRNYEYSITNPDGISRGSIHDIMKDRMGGYWIATYNGGLNYYHPQNNLFAYSGKVAGSDNTLSDNDITGFLEDKEGNLWISTGMGLNNMNKATGSIDVYTTEQGLSSNIIKAMVSDGEENLWIGTYSGLNYFNLKTASFTTFFHDPGKNSLNQDQINALHMDEDGLLWIGMNVGVFQVFNPKTGIFDNVSGVGSMVNVIFEDSKSRLWLGERFGLKCLDRHTRELIDISEITDKFDELYFINWISEDSHERIWIGTQNSGLLIIDSNNLIWLDKDNGLADNTINAILEDEAGHFWISTNSGISRIAFQLDKQGNPDIESVDFNKYNGLQGAQFNPGSAMKSSTGKLFFGGNNGYNAFFPHEIVKDNHFPQVVLSELQVNSRTITPGEDNSLLKRPINEVEALILKYSERNIRFRFAGINFINPGATVFQYMLLGVDEGWVDIGSQRSVNFTYLPVGTYELRLKASTSAEIWGTEFKSLQIVILPPWWKTWWAFVLYFALTVALLYAFFQYSQRWAALKNKLSMEQYKREREQSMLQSKLEFFTDVSHELRTPLTLILAPLEKIMLQKGISDSLYQQLLLIQRNSNRMMQLINQVLDLRKLETGQHQKMALTKGNIFLFLKEIFIAFSEIAHSKNIRFDFQASPELPELWYDRNKLEIIINNLLSNAFKHTPDGGEVVMSIDQADPSADSFLIAKKTKKKYVRISVKDNGEGIPTENLSMVFKRFFSGKTGSGVEMNGSGLGLELVRRMVKLHKGFVQAESRVATPTENGYTRFTVYLPTGRKHVPPNHIVEDMETSENIRYYPRDLQTMEDIGVYLPENTPVELPVASGKDKQSLLVVEDNVEVRAFIRDLFSDHYCVSEAENGLIGWKLAKDKIPELVISDIMMPEMNGIELCRKLKTDIRTSHIPVILLTARTIATYKYEGFQTGADEYITKPFSAQFLMLRVQNLIRQRELLRRYFQREIIPLPDNLPVTTVDEKLLRKAVAFISVHMSDSGLSVERLSNEIGLSRMHCHRKIKALTNMTTSGFIKSIRLQRAASLLKEKNLSIKEIQFLVGFEDADHFRNCFKAQFGETPSDYQKRANAS